MDINAYSATLTGASLGRSGEASPALFENWKKKKKMILEKKITVSIVGQILYSKCSFKSI